MPHELQDEAEGGSPYAQLAAESARRAALGQEMESYLRLLPLTGKAFDKKWDHRHLLKAARTLSSMPADKSGELSFFFGSVMAFNWQVVSDRLGAEPRIPPVIYDSQ